MPSLCHKIQPFTEPYIRCLLNNQQQAPTLIFINTVLSISYCSTVMLYALFNFLSYILLSALPSTSREESQVVVSPGTDSAWGRTLNNLTGHFRIEHRVLFVPCFLLCYKCLNIHFFPNNAVVYTFICQVGMNSCMLTVVYFPILQD